MTETQSSINSQISDVKSNTVLTHKAQSKYNLTVKNQQLLRWQCYLVIGFNLLSLAGVVVGGYQIVQEQVTGIDIGLFFTMYLMTGLGGTVGFHRYFTHKSFETTLPIKILLAIFGSMAAEGPLIYWVATHRRHHQYSDHPGDSHSPNLTGDSLWEKLKGFWQGHIGWLLSEDPTNPLLFAKDWVRDPVISQVNRLYFLWIFLGLALPTVVGGGFTGSWQGAFHGFIWGGLVRMFVVLHYSYGINSICHLWGRRPYKTTEQSTNNVWLGIPTLVGEAWHNNHHAFPDSAQFGLKLWQIDLGYGLIRTLERMKLVWNVKVPSQARLQSKQYSP